MLIGLCSCRSRSRCELFSVLQQASKLLFAPFEYSFCHIISQQYLLYRPRLSFRKLKWVHWCKRLGLGWNNKKKRWERDSNPQSSEPKSDALSIVLWGQTSIRRHYNVLNFYWRRSSFRGFRNSIYWYTCVSCLFAFAHNQQSCNYFCTITFRVILDTFEP